MDEPQGGFPFICERAGTSPDSSHRLSLFLQTAAYKAKTLTIDQQGLMRDRPEDRDSLSVRLPTPRTWHREAHRILQAIPCMSWDQDPKAPMALSVKQRAEMFTIPDLEDMHSRVVSRPS